MKENTKKRVVWFVLCTILAVSCIPVRVSKSTSKHIILQPLSLELGSEIVLGENRPSEYIYQNWSYEYYTDSRDVFSCADGRRPFPWGGEKFEGIINFYVSSDSYIGKRSFQMEGKAINSHGAIAVPDLPYKPDVIPGQIYYLGCWVKYNIEKGYGVRLAQQFFLPSDSFYPNYVCYGEWLTGKSNGWIYLGLLVQAPESSYKGDPVIELWGQGNVWVDEVYFGSVTIDKIPGGVT